MSNVVALKHSRTHTAAPPTKPTLAVPFLKWPGGKRPLIPAIKRHFPDDVKTYWEPFVGGGAVFFALAGLARRVVLSDTNEDLIITYRVVKDDVDRLLDCLGEHERAHRRRDGRQYADGSTYYYRVRASEPRNHVEVAARFIYLNKTCFNGLYRVNKAGRFNVPEGGYVDPDICNAERLRLASAALTNAKILLGGFERVVQPASGDFVYCDPPYDGCFAAYQSAGFTHHAQERLRERADAWVAAGADVLLSNADTPTMRRLYDDDRYSIESVKAPRNISGRASGRGTASELLIRSA